MLKEWSTHKREFWNLNNCNLKEQKIETEEELKIHEIEIQAKAKSTCPTKQSSILSKKPPKLEVTKTGRNIRK